MPSRDGEWRPFNHSAWEGEPDDETSAYPARSLHFCAPRRSRRDPEGPHGCPKCGSGIASFDQVELLPQHFCARCGFDLRAAPKVSVKARAQRLERAIADMARVEAVKSPPADSDLIPRLLRAPVVAEIPSAKSLTGLSTAAPTLRRLIAEIAGGPKPSKAELRNAVRRSHAADAPKPYDAMRPATPASAYHPVRPKRRLPVEDW